MAKGIRCIVYGSTRWGYEMTGVHFNSISQATKTAQWNMEKGYWFSYRLVRVNNCASLK